MTKPYENEVNPKYQTLFEDSYGKKTLNFIYEEVLKSLKQLQEEGKIKLNKDIFAIEVINVMCKIGEENDK